MLIVLIAASAMGQQNEPALTAPFVLGPQIAPGFMREGAFTDGLSALVVPNGRRSKATINVLPQDEVWLLDGRTCHHRPHDLSAISVRRLFGQNWADDCLASLVSAHSADKTKATFIYAHGNRTDEDWAMWRGLQFYQNSFGECPANRPPVRFVIWSWQSEQERCRPSSDYIEKSYRATVVGKTLASVLAEFSDQQMVLAGFSLGSQALLSALGQPSLLTDPNVARSGQYRVTLLAPALDGCYVAAQLNQCPQSTSVARAVIFDNSIDRALRVSKYVRRKQCGDGDFPIIELARRGNLPLSNIAVRDMAAEVGRGHSVDTYTSNPTIRATLNDMLREVASGTTNGF